MSSEIVMWVAQLIDKNLTDVKNDFHIWNKFNHPLNQKDFKFNYYYCCIQGLVMVISYHRKSICMTFEKKV